MSSVKKSSTKSHADPVNTSSKQQAKTKQPSFVWNNRIGYGELHGRHNLCSNHDLKQIKSHRVQSHKEDLLRHGHKRSGSGSGSGSRYDPDDIEERPVVKHKPNSGHTTNRRVEIADGSDSHENLQQESSLTDSVSDYAPVQPKPSSVTKTGIGKKTLNKTFGSR